MEDKIIWLTQSQAARALGITLGKFIGTIRTNYKNRPGYIGKKKITEYGIPLKDMTEDAQEEYSEDNEIDTVLQSMVNETDLGSTILSDQLKEVRIKKVNAEIEYLNQKIETRKKELFAEWSERFFKVFCNNFSKFKNSLIELHLDDNKISILNENLDYAIKGIENSLDEILNDFLNEKDEDEDEKE